MSKSRIPASDGGSSKPKDNQMADLTENLRGFSASDGGSSKPKDNQMADLTENLRGFSIKQIKVSLAMFAAESQVDFDKQMRVWCSQYRSAADHFYPNVQCLFIVNPTEEEKEEIENFIADEKTAKADRILYDATNGCVYIRQSARFGISQEEPGVGPKGINDSRGGIHSR